ncbi:MAG: hypothetical protein IPP72_20010 [Chitinophagaceae bacterium]|nr:hypothetical protein [Chitinophagaceae bacterium]
MAVNMENYIPESEQLVNELAGMKLLDSHHYWAKKRLLFNIIVGVAGLIATLEFASNLSVFDVLGILMWGFVANAFYSTGYVIESYVIVKTSGLRNLKKIRKLLFWAGTIAYALVSLFFATNYFTMASI